MELVDTEDGVAVSGVDTDEEAAHFFESIIVDAKSRQPGKYVWMMVAPGERKPLLKALRKYIKMTGHGPAIEHVVKIVEEEKV